jgi:hypothetical protein
VLSWEHVLLRILRARDPGAALRRAREDDRLDPSVRTALRCVDEDGLRLAALLVARLRFERLVQGDPAAAQWFEQDPAEFSPAFRAYHTEVSATAFFPRGEADQFARWCDRRAIRSTTTGCRRPR